VDQCTCIERFQVPSWITYGLLFKLNKANKIAEPEDDPTSHYRPYPLPPEDCPHEGSPCRHEKRSNHLGTQGIKANINEESDQSAKKGTVEEQHPTK